MVHSKVLYIGLLYNYGKPDEGFSYEHMNIEAGLRDCADREMFEVCFWYPDNPSMILLHNQWCELQDVRDIISECDAIFHVAFNEHLDLPESVAKLALLKDIPIIQWDCDSSWRFNSWILPRKNRVSHFVTTHSATIPWYRSQGMKVIKSQWGGSPYYLPNESDIKYDVTFIGQKHGQMPNGRFVRAEIIDALISAGVNIDLFGSYWDGYPNWHGYVKNFEDVINVFRQSKICLNLSNPWHYNTMPQIKGRHFEIPQAGRLQITTPADDLISYFKEDEEIVIAKSVNELIDKIKFYLENEKERESIAQAGHARILAEHQWHRRFTEIFSQL